MEEMLQPSTPEHVIYFTSFEWDNNNQIDEKLNVLDQQRYHQLSRIGIVKLWFGYWKRMKKFTWIKSHDVVNARLLYCPLNR